MHKTKAIWYVKVIKYIPNDYSANGLCSVLFGGACELQLVSDGLETISKDANHSCSNTSLATHTTIVCISSVTRTVRPHKTIECMHYRLRQVG